VGGPGWGSAPATTARRRRRWTCRCLRWPNDSSGWRRRCRSRSGCGPTTRRRSRACTTGSGVRSTAPGPAQRPHPPILIGGAGERRTLRLVARYADACNLPDIPDAGRTVKHKLAVLAGHCADVGRPYAAIEKTLAIRLEAGESSDDFVRRAVAAAQLAIEHLGVITAGAWRPQALATAIAQLRELRPPQTPPTAP
jgi:alkanesulfonate monooxygenase SsuD/methylene tetrahydromethanopterin reductase-like flavin-dependent oxidoreductase (luciferase family)